MKCEELAMRIKGGDPGLYSELWEKVRLLIAKRANSFILCAADTCAQCGVTVDDLTQAGFLALADAVKAYDPAKEYAFTTYLTFHLKKHFRATLNGGKRRNDKAAPDSLNLGVSLNAPIGADEDLTLGDTIPTADQCEQVDESIFISQLHDALETEICQNCTPEQALVLRCWFFDGETLQCIADKNGFTRSKVADHQRRALSNLRIKSRHRLMPYMQPEFYAWRGNSLSAFKNSGASGIERAVEKAEMKRYG